MRFLMVNTVFPPAFARGGPPRVNFQLARALLDLGQHVTVLTSNAGTDSKRLFLTGNIKSEYLGVPVVYLPILGFQRYYFAPKLIKEIISRKGDFDICLLRGQWTFFSITTAIICRLINKPFIVYPEGCLDPWALKYHGAKKKAYWKLVEQYVYKWADGIIALSKAEICQIQKMGISRPITIIPNGIDPKEFMLSKKYIWKYLSPDLRNKRIILFFSRIHPKKGLDLLVEAFAHIHAKFRDTILLVVGPSEDKRLEAEVLSLVHDLGLDDHVRFLGMVKDNQRLAILHAAHVLVLPSYSEGMPLAILEAAVCKTPIVISPACYLPEFETGGGIIVDTSSTEIATAVCSILENKEKWKAMRDAAQSIVLKYFTWGHVAEQTVKFCSSLVSGK